MLSSRNSSSDYAPRIWYSSTDNSQGTLEVASWSRSNRRRGDRRPRQNPNHGTCTGSTWSGRPDPLLMGGDNDRVIGQRLYHTALAWDYLQPLLNDEERAQFCPRPKSICRKFTISPCCSAPTWVIRHIDPHSLGAWNGAAIACMAFYEDLPIARHALPLFHGLFCDSLKLFPASGKAAWATYFPFHLVLYLAAAHAFGARGRSFRRARFSTILGRHCWPPSKYPTARNSSAGCGRGNTAF